MLLPGQRIRFSNSIALKACAVVSNVKRSLDVAATFGGGSLPEFAIGLSSSAKLILVGWQRPAVEGATFYIFPDARDSVKLVVQSV